MKGSLLQAACGMEIFMNSIIGNKKARSAVEQTAEIIFTICAFFAVLAVISITVYMFLNGTPALTKVGLTEILFSTVWKPTAADPSYGILYVILTSIVGTTLAILLGVPIGVLTAVFLAETAPEPLSKIVRPAIELLAGIPSVIYGLLGILLLCPAMYKLEQKIFAGSVTHQFTGGACPCDHDLAYCYQYQRIRPPQRSCQLKGGLPGSGCFQDPDNFPCNNPGSQIRYRNRHRPRCRTCDR